MHFTVWPGLTGSDLRGRTKPSRKTEAEDKLWFWIDELEEKLDGREFRFRNPDRGGLSICQLLFFICLGRKFIYWFNFFSLFLPPLSPANNECLNPVHDLPRKRFHFPSHFVIFLFWNFNFFFFTLKMGRETFTLTTLICIIKTKKKQLDRNCLH